MFVSLQLGTNEPMALTLMLQTTRWLREQDADGDGRLSYKVNTVEIS